MLNFTMSELIHSVTANLHKINNVPTDPKILDNMLNLIVYCLQPLRNKVCKPIIITSGYRCEKVNKLVGGVSNSQHQTGQAVDFTIKGMTVAQAVEYIKNSGIEFDQLINEYGAWVHISYHKGHNRRDVRKIG